MGKFTPSKYQVEIDREFTEENTNILIAAVAGSGKTTTLLSLLKKVKGSGIYLAFNKSIVEELKEKVGFIPRVQIMTLHSLGMKAIIRLYGGVRVNDSKTVDACQQFFTEWGFDKKNKEWWRLSYTIRDLYSLYRLKMCRMREDLIEACDSLGIEWDDKTINYVLEIHDHFLEANKHLSQIDFTDMIYLPATNPKIQFPKPDVTFVDECQDLNEAQHRLIDKLIGDRRFVACGDRKQSIYGFSGADSNSFDRFLVKSNVKELPLSVCYRCSKNIVKEANKIYDIMEPFENNTDGVVDRRASVLDSEEGDMIICRNTAPLITVYFNLLKRNKRAYVKGKDIGKNLIALVSKYRVGTSRQLMVALDESLEKIKKDLKEKRGIENGESHPKYVAFKEKRDIVKIFKDRYYTTSEILKSLEFMFSDSSQKGVILSTIHKSKGLEADTVYFLDRELIPSKYATTTDQMKQEKNLEYVGITRAKSRLVFCQSE